VPAFFATERPEYVDALLDASALEATGVFDQRAVAGLLKRCQSGRPIGVRESQALVSILSTQLWHQEFHSHRPPQTTRLPRADVELSEVVEAQT
jgi:hypothetical protein